MNTLRRRIGDAKTRALVRRLRRRRGFDKFEERANALLDKVPASIDQASEQGYTYFDFHPGSFIDCFWQGMAKAGSFAAYLTGRLTELGMKSEHVKTGFGYTVRVKF